MVSTVPDSCKSEFALTDNFWDFSIYMLKLACTRRKKLAVGLLQVLVCLTDLKKEEEKDQCVCVCVCAGVRACMCSRWEGSWVFASAAPVVVWTDVSDKLQ